MASGTGVGPPRPVRERQGQNDLQLNNNRAAPPKLEFYQAMKDFKHMFPTLDDEVIEAVLRANNGLVDATIDQLLSMGAGAECETNSVQETSDFPSLPSYTQTTEHNEPPPAYTPRADEGILLDIPVTTECAPPVFSPVPDVRTTRAYKAWNPPLLGQLPDDFLRLDLTDFRSSSRTETMHSAQSDNSQLLEDEKMALYLQNAEFMSELSRNKEFLTSLERDQSRSTGAPQTPDQHSSNFSTSDQYQEEQRGSIDSFPVSPGSEEDFKEKLKHMGKSTRKKFNQLAKVFSRKKRPVMTSEGSGMSTANLLQDYEDDSEDDDDLIRDHRKLDAVKESDSEDDDKTNANQRKSRSERSDHDPVEFFAEDNEFQYKPEETH